MANILASVGGGVGTFIESSIGNVLTVIVIFLVVILIFGLAFFLFWWKSYDVRVKIYRPVGQVKMTDEEMVELKYESDPEEALKKLKERSVRFDYLRFRVTHGKHTKVKGAPYFQTFRPMRKLAPIPLTMMYDDGIHLVQLSRDILVPIQKPNITLEVGKNVSITVEEDVQWKTWNNMMADRINNKYQDLDAQRKIAFYFIVGIVGIVLIGGFILWLIYRLSVKGITFDDRLSDFAKGLVGGNTPA